MKVHLTFWPDVELEVSESDYLDFKRAGVLVEENNEKTPIKPEPKNATAETNK